MIKRGSSVPSFGVEAVWEERPVAFTTEIWVMLRDKRRRNSVKCFMIDFIEALHFLCLSAHTIGKNLLIYMKMHRQYAKSYSEKED